MMGVLNISHAIKFFTFSSVPSFIHLDAKSLQMDEKWQGLRIINPILGKAQKDEKV